MKMHKQDKWFYFYPGYFLSDFLFSKRIIILTNGLLSTVLNSNSHSQLETEAMHSWA